MSFYFKNTVLLFGKASSVKCGLSKISKVP